LSYDAKATSWKDPSLQKADPKAQALWVDKMYKRIDIERAYRQRAFAALSDAKSSIDQGAPIEQRCIVLWLRLARLPG
jgi:hypothetical protein